MSHSDATDVIDVISYVWLLRTSARRAGFSMVPMHAGRASKPSARATTDTMIVPCSAKMTGLNASNEHDRLSIARDLIQAAAEAKPAAIDRSSTESDSLESEFSGDREGKTTYCVRCQKCVDQPPMHTEYRIPGHDTMRFLTFIIAMQMYLSGKRSKPPEPRPSGLPNHFARLEDLPPIHSNPPRQRAINVGSPSDNRLSAAPFIKAQPP